MIPLETIKKYKLDSQSLKPLFTADTPKKGIKSIVDRIANIVREGKERNFCDYKIWAAVDMAHDTPFAQTTPTILRSIAASCGTPDEMIKSLRGWGIDEKNLFCCEQTTDASGNPAKKYTFNGPVFYNVFVPLVRSYVVIRLSKIFNDRNLTPLFEYPPLHPTAETRLLCEVLTDVVEVIATNFGYSAVLRQFIFNALMYSVAIKFPVEAWTKDMQEGVDGEEFIEKEGIRYVVPHVSRIFYDLNYPLATLNTGTGCAYAGYWTVLRWGEVKDHDTSYWNLSKVPHGTNWLDSRYSYNYFNEVYPCAFSFPKSRGKDTDREDMVQNSFYYKGDYDSAFFATYLFMELVPSEWDMGDYDNKVWFKFTIGADRTVMYVEPYPYRPIDYIGYDADSGRGRNASLALEILPFQDLTGNTLSQILLTIKRNLTNIVLYNNNVLKKTDIEDLNKKSNLQYQQLNFIGFDGLQMERTGSDMDRVVKSVTFPTGNVQEGIQSLNTIINLLERVLVVSAQETGSSASHQQSKKEVEIANANTSNRVQYTASFVDEGIDAWKRQLQEAAVIYMSANEVEANVSTDIPNLTELIEKLGFKYVDGPPQPEQRKVRIAGKLKSEKLVQFAARRADSDRANDQQTAQAMFTCIQTISNSQVLSQIIQPASFAAMLETATKLAGADDDFKVEINQNAVTADQVMKVAQQIMQEVMASVENQAVKPAADAISALQQKGQEQQQKDAEQDQAIEQITAALEKIMQLANRGGAAPPPQPMQPPSIPPNGNPPPVNIPA